MPMMYVDWYFQSLLCRAVPQVPTVCSNVFYELMTFRAPFESSVIAISDGAACSTSNSPIDSIGTDVVYFLSVSILS